MLILIVQIMAHQALYMHIHECCIFWFQSENKQGVFMEDFTYLQSTIIFLPRV